MRKTIIVNDDFNSASRLASVISSNFQVIDIFEKLRTKENWTLAEIKNKVIRSLSGKNTNEILILDIELSTAHQNGIRLLEFLRMEGYRQPVFIFSDYLSRLGSYQEAIDSLIRIGLDERLIWTPIIESQLRNIGYIFNDSNSITKDKLTKAQDVCKTPGLYEIYIEVMLQLISGDLENVKTTINNFKENYKDIKIIKDQINNYNKTPVESILKEITKKLKKYCRYEKKEFLEYIRDRNY